MQKRCAEKSERTTLWTRLQWEAPEALSPVSCGFQQVKRIRQGYSSQCLNSIYIYKFLIFFLLENEESRVGLLDIVFTARFYSQISRANHALLIDNTAFCIF